MSIRSLFVGFVSRFQSFFAHRVAVNTRRAMPALAVTVGVLLFCLPLRSQVNTGRISGTITDQAGGAIVGAAVTVVDVDRGIERPLVTDSAGEYAAPNLIPGQFAVRAQAKGFKITEGKNVDVGVGSDVRVDLSLQPGEQTQTITVTSEVPAVNTTNAQTGGTLDNSLIQNLPLNGRNYRNVVNLLPGVVLTPGGGVYSQSTNGGLTNWDNYMLDGLYDQSNLTGQSTVGSIGSSGDSTLLPLDAIQEVNLVENPKAEYGWFPGVTMNVGLKSGTNNIHGTAYAYGRDTALDAKNAFAQPNAKSPLAFEQWGATLGGPIRKNELFYFVGYESLRESIGVISSSTAPTTDAGLGPASSLPDAIADVNEYIATNPGTRVAVSPLSLNLAGCTNNGSTVAANINCSANSLGAPGLFNNSSASTTLSRDYPDSGGSDQGLGKIDYHINDHHTVNGEFYMGNYGENVAIATTTEPFWENRFNTRGYDGRLVEVWTPNSNWLNEARWGYDYQAQPNYSTECSPSKGDEGQAGSPNYTSNYQFVSGVVTGNILACGFPSITISGFTAGLGGTRGRQTTTIDNQGADSVSYTHGKHQFKFGTDIRAQAYDGAQPSEKGSIAFGAKGFAAFSVGGVTATALEDFVAGEPNQESLQTPVSLNHIAYKQVAIFAQDDWRVSPRLTANLGVRWELETSARDANGLIGNFDPSAPSGMVQSNELWKTLSDFTPHIGFAWDVSGRGTSVIRAGLSLANPPQNMLVYNNTLVTVPTGATLYAANGSTIQGPGNIDTLTKVATATTTGGVITTPLSWAINSPIFPSGVSQQCGNGLAATTPLGAGVPPGFINPAPCSINAQSPSFTLPLVTTWNLSAEHAFTNNLSLNLTYVGTHGSKLTMWEDLNQPTPGATGSGEQLRRPYYSEFPWFTQILYGANFGNSNYDGLQATLTKRVSHRLTFVAGYGLSHALTINSSTSDAYNGTAMNTADPLAEYGNTSNDVRNQFTFTTTYDLPGRKSPLQLLEGWEINAHLTLMSALPVEVYDSKFDTSGTGTGLDRWDLYGPAQPFNQILGGAGTVPCYGLAGSSLLTASGSHCIVVAAAGDFPAACIAGANAEAPGPAGVTDNTGITQLNAIGCYEVNGSAITPPAQGTFGTMGNNELRGKGVQLFDLALTKSTQIKERLTIQFRAEAFNVLNITQYAQLDSGGVFTNLSSPSTFGQSQSTPDVAKSFPAIGSGGPREIQLSLKFIF
jgi:outer membrane receptor protein involved in Fe transport